MLRNSPLSAAAALAAVAGLASVSSAQLAVDVASGTVSPDGTPITVTATIDAALGGDILNYGNDAVEFLADYPGDEFVISFTLDGRSAYRLTRSSTAVNFDYFIAPASTIGSTGTGTVIEFLGLGGSSAEDGPNTLPAGDYLLIVEENGGLIGTTPRTGGSVDLTLEFFTPTEDFFEPDIVVDFDGANTLVENLSGEIGVDGNDGNISFIDSYIDIAEIPDGDFQPGYGTSAEYIVQINTGGAPAEILIEETFAGPYAAALDYYLLPALERFDFGVAGFNLGAPILDVDPFPTQFVDQADGQVNYGTFFNDPIFLVLDAFDSPPAFSNPFSATLTVQPSTQIFTCGSGSALTVGQDLGQLTSTTPANDLAPDTFGPSAVCLFRNLDVSATTFGGGQELRLGPEFVYSFTVDQAYNTFSLTNNISGEGVEFDYVLLDGLGKSSGVDVYNNGSSVDVADDVIAILADTGTLSVDLVPATTYYLLVDSIDEFGGIGNISIAVSNVDEPFAAVIDPINDPSTDLGEIGDNLTAINFNLCGGDLDTEIGIWSLDNPNYEVGEVAALGDLGCPDNADGSANFATDFTEFLPAGNYILSVSPFNTFFDSPLIATTEGDNTPAGTYAGAFGSATIPATLLPANNRDLYTFSVGDAGAFPVPAVEDALGVVATEGNSFEISGCANVDFDQEIGLYSSDGVLLEADDDDCGLLATGSRILLPDGLPAGTYYLAAGEFPLTFGNGFVVTGSSDAATAFTTEVGTGTASGSTPPTGFLWFSFEVGEDTGGPVACNAADLDADGDNDLIDAFAFLDAYDAVANPPLTPPATTAVNAADLDADGDNDLVDAFAFLDAYDTVACPDVSD